MIRSLNWKPNFKSDAMVWRMEWTLFGPILVILLEIGAFYRGILNPYCIFPKNSASSRPYQEINGYNLQEFDTRTTLSHTNATISPSMLSESRGCRFDKINDIFPAGLFCRLQVAGCRLKFHYNWKTADTKKKHTSVRLTVTDTWRCLRSLSKMASKPTEWEESI